MSATASPGTEGNIATPRIISYAEDQRFFLKLAVAISVVTIAAFAQLALRGVTKPLTAPLWMHVHALVMLSWLGLFIAQNRLATSNLALHRRLGWAAVLLACVMVPLGWFTAIRSTALHRFPPEFSASFFLAWPLIQISVFGALLTAAILLRRDAQSHRRLILGATLVLCGGPAVARLSPLTLQGNGVALIIAVAVELGILLTVLLHDRRSLGAVHPATLWAMAALSLSQIAALGFIYGRA